MEYILGFLTLNRFELLLNFIGTLIVAYSLGKNPEDAYSLGKNGRKIYLVSVLRPIWFKLGMFTIGIGFLYSFLPHKSLAHLIHSILPRRIYLFFIPAILRPLEGV